MVHLLISVLLFVGSQHCYASEGDRLLAGGARVENMDDLERQICDPEVEKLQKELEALKESQKGAVKRMAKGALCGLIVGSGGYKALHSPIDWTAMVYSGVTGAIFGWIGCAGNEVHTHFRKQSVREQIRKKSCPINGYGSTKAVRFYLSEPHDS